VTIDDALILVILVGTVLSCIQLWVGRISLHMHRRR
jgi:hypothetical protein